MGKKEDEQEKASPAYTVTKIRVYSRGISHSAFRNESEYLMHKLTLKRQLPLLPQCVCLHEACREVAKTFFLSFFGLQFCSRQSYTTHC